MACVATTIARTLLARPAEPTKAAGPVRQDAIAYSAATRLQCRPLLNARLFPSDNPPMQPTRHR